MTKITIPAEHLAKVQELSNQDTRLDIQLEICTAKYKAAVAALNLEEAYAAKMEGKAAALASIANHKAMWAYIREAMPETTEGDWSLEVQEWYVSPSGRRNPSQGLGDLLGSLAGVMKD